MKRVLVVGILVLAVTAACGKSPEQKQAEETAAAVKQMADGAQKMAEGAQGAAAGAEQGMAQMMQGLQQMAQGAQGNTQPVDYEKLKELIPELSGWERSGVKGQQTTMGISVSTAEARYTQGDASLKLEITDTSFSKMVLAPFMMFARAGYSERSDDGYKKGMTLAGFPGFESWEKNSKNGEVHVLVADRFIVNAEGQDVDSTEPAKQLIQAIDLKKLSTLK